MTNTAPSDELNPCRSPTATTALEPMNDDSDHDSLFDEPRHDPDMRMAMRSAPPIPGLFLPAIRLPSELADDIMQQALQLYFRDTNVNQVMLFGRVNSLSENAEVQTSNGLPAFLISLISTLEELLRPVLPPPTHTLLFPPKTAPPRARQAILNLYNPGEGISPHVELLNRFGDGIMGISMGSGCVMNFEKHREHKDMDDEGKERWELFLPERSIIVMTEDARYSWKHGIEGRQEDLVESEEATDSEAEWIARGTRLSITLRWLLPGADIVGRPDQQGSSHIQTSRTNQCDNSNV